MLESGLSGSVRGVPSDGHPYRDPRPNPDIWPSAIRCTARRGRHKSVYALAAM